MKIQSHVISWKIRGVIGFEGHTGLWTKNLGDAKFYSDVSAVNKKASRRQKGNGVVEFIVLPVTIELK